MADPSTYVTPLPGGDLQQGFKPGRHDGVDLGLTGGNPAGMTIIAPKDGTVVYVSYGEAAGGNVTNINHPDGVQTRYDHQEVIFVVVGQDVVQGQAIGLVGATGAVTGPHLHYEVRQPVGNPLDPVPFLNPYQPPTPPDPPPPPRQRLPRKDPDTMSQSIYRLRDNPPDFRDVLVDTTAKTLSAVTDADSDEGVKAGIARSTVDKAAWEKYRDSLTDYTRVGVA